MSATDPDARMESADDVAGGDAVASRRPTTTSASKWSPEMQAFPEDRVRDDAASTGQRRIPRYGDDVWDLSLLDHGHTGGSMRNTWSTFPERFREPLRAAAWTMLNKGLDEELLGLRTVNLAQYPSPGTADDAIGQWRVFARWLVEKRPSIWRLCDVTTDDLRAYARHIRHTRRSYDARRLALNGVSRLYGHSWLHDPADRLPKPPWLDGPIAAYLRAKPRRGENAIPPINPETISALLIAAIACIDDFLTEHQEPVTPLTLPEPTITWMTGACLAVIDYLTGMRPQEVLSLDDDCLTVAINPTGGGVRYEVRGVQFKNQRDDDGRYLTAGQSREQPWITIEAGAKAIQVARILALAADEQGRILRNPDSKLLFPRGRSRKDARAGGGLTTRQANERIAAFIDYINSTRAQSGQRPIPTDPEGKVTLPRFRRTLAWHIARQPLGEVALGVQYGHLRVVTGQGYAGRAEAGLQGLIEWEEHLDAVERFDELAEGRRRGERVSGPASERLNAAVTRYESQYAGSKTTDKQLQRQMAATPGMQVYDNPRALSLCVFRRSTAACHVIPTSQTQQRTTPSLDECRWNCANHARTDQHIALLREERHGLVAEVEQSPQPIAIRLRERITEIDETVAEHEVA